MKLVWSPETASKAYIDTVKSVSNLLNGFYEKFWNFLFSLFFFFLLLPFLRKISSGFPFLTEISSWVSIFNENLIWVSIYNEILIWVFSTVRDIPRIRGCRAGFSHGSRLECEVHIRDMVTRGTNPDEHRTRRR